ncbi:uncharacterized protein LOC103966906 isoform X2 [Pyrus x bretschneideri]|uniref:uncharacterized protein LOC103966906 isoform X2 n=1 Tax=Pyrus x bretschneideri TaxID=225117 RepID=UPI00202F0CF8|nr:uncharacterized protein LOC103966906 isoform X2 [Pyrus x bretschneideri]
MREGQVGGIRIKNPFTLKLGQVFTGFGVGCGVGIGVGRPINLGTLSLSDTYSFSLKSNFIWKMDLGRLFKPKNGETHQTQVAKKPCAIPALNQVMGATRGATDALSGVSRHVNNTLRKVGAKNIEAGIGCGVGIGHGFGVGLAPKPGLLQQIQFRFVQGMTKMMMKFGIFPNLPIGQAALPSSLQGAMGTLNDLSQNKMGSNTQLSTKLTDYTSQGLPGYGRNRCWFSS